MVFFLDSIQEMRFPWSQSGKDTTSQSESYQHFEAVNEMLPGETRRRPLECIHMVLVVNLAAGISHMMLKMRKNG